MVLLQLGRAEGSVRRVHSTKVNQALPASCACACCFPALPYPGPRKQGGSEDCLKRVLCGDGTERREKGEEAKGRVNQTAIHFE